MSPGILRQHWVHLLQFPSLTGKFFPLAKISGAARAGEERRRIMLRGAYKVVKILFSYPWKSIKQALETAESEPQLLYTHPGVVPPVGVVLMYSSSAPQIILIKALIDFVLSKPEYLYPAPVKSRKVDFVAVENYPAVLLCFPSCCPREVVFSL